VDESTGESAGLAAVLARSRAPVSHPGRINPAVEDLAVQVRQRLAAQGWDCGPLSVLANWPENAPPPPSRAQLARIFGRRGLVKPQPQKRPRSSYRSYARPAPNELWYSDGFDWPLADGTVVTVLQLNDDCSRYDLGARAATGETSAEIKAMLTSAIAIHGVPQEFLSDNHVSYNPHRRGWRGEVAGWLRSLGVRTITCSVGHPQGNGKAERAHQTLQKWLTAQPQAVTLDELQTQLDIYREAYNNRAHQGLGGATPQQVWDSLPHADPPDPPSNPDHVLARTIKVSANGNVAVSGWGSVNIGSRHKGRHVHVLVNLQTATITIFDGIGTEIRTVTIDPSRAYYPLKLDRE
jgi:transposase InsO family protein